MYTAPLLLLLILLISAYASYTPEPFQERNTQKILTSNRLNYEHKYPNQLMSITDKAWDYVLFKINTGVKLDVFGYPGRVILNPLDYLEYAPKNKYEELPPSFFFTFTSQRKKNNYQCGYDFQNKTIGYFDRTEKKFIETVMFAYRISPRKLVYLTIEELASPNTWETIDMAVAFISAGSPYAKLFEQQELALLSIRDILFDRIRLTNPYLIAEEKWISDFFSKTAKIVFPESQMYLIGMPMYLTVVDTNFVEPFITQLKMSPEFYDPKFQCVGDDLAVSKLECESPYNPFGEPKLTPSVVDKPCKTNNDCPFYKANKNYPNDFGRCLPDGKCEFPLGIMRIGYRTYYSRDPYQPFCYQCKNPKDPLCCEDQDLLAARNQTFLKSADYAFPNDTPLRKLNKLPTYIKLPN